MGTARVEAFARLAAGSSGRMPLVVLLAASLVSGLAAALIVLRFPRRATRPSLEVARRAGEATAERRGLRRVVAPRLDPGELTGLALSVAVVVIVAGGVVLGVLA